MPQLRQSPIRFLAAVLILFAIFGAARLNPFCLLEPDSPDYLLTARALGGLDGYRAPHLPGEPLQTFRPPGLPLLLAPLALVRPYDVVSAKALVLAISLFTLALTWLYARRCCGAAAAWVVPALIASSPYMLLHATEVVSEVPYLACLLGVLLLADDTDRPPRWKQVAWVTALLAFLPFLRTIGVTMIAALALWAVCARSRHRWLAAAAVAGLVSAAWGWRNAAVGGPTYLDAVTDGLSGVGASPAAWAGQALYYLERLPHVLLPGFIPGQPLYERVLIGDAPNLGGLLGGATLLAWAIVALAVRGLFRCRASLVGAHAALYLIALAVYPPRHERLLWPLVPLIWIFVPAGVIAVRDRLSSLAPRIGFRTSVAAGAAAALIVAWQATQVLAMDRTNLHWYLEGDRFYSERVPPSYYADWQAAGRWVRDHTPPHARLLTRHSDVAFSARRYIDSIRFAELSPAVWRSRIPALPARWLVVPTSRFGKWFHWQALDNDPVYRMTPVYEARDVMVLEVQPNLTGRVAPSFRDLDQRLASCRRAVERYPERAELLTRLAELLRDGDRADEGVALLEHAIATGRDDVRLHVTLGRLLLELQRGEDAATSLRRAAARPRAELYTKTIERGLRRAAEQTGAAARSPVEEALAHVERAKARIDALAYGPASADVERAVELAPAHPDVQFVRAELQQRFGRLDEAVAGFGQALAGGHPDAARKLRLLRTADALEDGGAARFTVGAEPFHIDRTDPLAWLDLARDYGADGTPGRALALLQQARPAFPASPEIALGLADLLLFYGRADEIEAVLSELPQRGMTRQRLEAGRRALQAASF